MKLSYLYELKPRKKHKWLDAKLAKKSHLKLKNPQKHGVLWTSASGQAQPFKPKIAHYMGVARTTPMY